MNSKENELYIISGSCGVGKSTISRNLAQKYSLSAHINVDDIYGMYVGGYVKPWEDDGSRLDLVWKNLRDMITNYTESGYEVIVDYVIFPENLSKIIPRGITAKYVVLTADEETVIRRDLLRPEDEIMGNRVVELLKEFNDANIKNRFILDTTKLSVNEIIDIITKDDRFLL